MKLFEESEEIWERLQEAIDKIVEKRLEQEKEKVPPSQTGEKDLPNNI
jgi:predicted RNase H-like HicB family nuclease